MLSHGYWKLELKRTIRALRFWRKMAGGLQTARLEHQINRQILYSAMIVRKIIENEKWAKDDLKGRKVPEARFEILETKIKIIKYPCNSEEKFIGFSLFPKDYDMKKKEEELLPLEHACNSIIHSYVWEIIWSGREIVAFGVASERFKEKCVYLIMLDDWLDKLDFCLKYGNV